MQANVITFIDRLNFDIRTMKLTYGPDILSTLFLLKMLLATVKVLYGIKCKNKIIF